MIRFVTISVVITVIACGLVYKLRDVPAVGQLLLSDTDASEISFAWPPRVGEPYPDLKLVDQTGATTRLADFRGKVILVELIGIPCGACQAFAGAHKKGAFRGAKVQSNLESIHVYARKYGRFDLNDDRVVFVQILLFNTNLQAPTLAEARAWADHFGMDRSKNRIVLAGSDSLATKQSYNLIPGFHLINRDFVLIRDSSGHHPTHNLYTDLLPAMGKEVH